MGSPFLVHKTKFVISSSKKYASYVDYIGRKDAIRDKNFNKYSLYNDYMDNEMKSSGLFSSDKNNLSEEEKKHMKNLFTIAKNNKSILWQDVFSFDNKKLEELGFYNSNTKDIDEVILREATCNAMNTLLKEDNLKESAIWTASIHYNTKNIHVHIATCEPYPTKSRGKRKPKTMQSMKSKFANTLIDYDKNYTKINAVIRDNLINDKKEILFDKDMTLANDRHLKYLYKKAIDSLPENKKHWQYGYNTMKPCRVYLDRITDYYLMNYKLDDYKDLENLLTKQEQNFKSIYGDGDHNKYKDYKKNKKDDLYKRMGNSTLKEIKIMIGKDDSIKLSKKDIVNVTSYQNEETKNISRTLIDDIDAHYSEDKNKYLFEVKKEKYKKLSSENTIDARKFKKRYINSKDINKLKHELGNEISNYKNQIVYERLQQEIEYHR